MTLQSVTEPPRPGTCLAVGCDHPATHAYRSRYGTWWHLGCPLHGPAMQSALSIGQAQHDAEVVTVSLTSRRPPTGWRDRR